MAELLPDDLTRRIRSIVQAALLAPSAENTQPWQFVIDSDTLVVSLDRARTLASDIDSMLSLTAIGACIENAVIAASAINLQTDVRFVVDNLPANLAADVIPIAELR